MKQKLYLMLAVTFLMTSIFAGSLVSAKPFGSLYLNGDTVRTFGNPSALPHGGSNPLYVVSNGVSGQLGVAGYGPGEKGYRGGAWAFHDVAFNANVTSYLLMSDEDVMAAQLAGDVTITRVNANDFRCPVLP